MKHQAKIFHSLVIQGKLLSAVRWITYRGKGRVFHPGCICPKTGKNVFEVLRSKHPGVRPPMVGIFEAYGGKPPTFVPVEITNERVAYIVKQLTGEAGPGGTDLVSLQHWLLQFGSTSAELLNISMNFGEWMSNGRPPWAAYRALMLGCLVGLGK